MLDYYKILGVAPTATVSEIKRAYRKKAKELHPDVLGTDTEEFRTLVLAYEILSSAHQRTLFDINYSRQKKYNENSNSTSGFDYRQWLLEKTDVESKCKLIFFDLINHNEDEAVELFKNLNMSVAGFTLSKWFSREDFMDYGFILSEELFFRGEYYDAIILLEEIILMERKSEYFKHFFPEVIKFAKEIFKRYIEGNLEEELALDAWERALNLRFSKTDDAFFLVKIADVYNKMGDESTCIICLTEALKLDPKVFIPKELRKKI